jgi:DNA-binding NarL/FixJ family response regulator
MESQTKSRMTPLPSSDSDFVTSAALESEIKSFCSAHHLTPRECEILGSLVEGVVRIKDIAIRMTLSPNTVNNHVNSIFVKTKARSKSQLLSHLLTYVAEELQAARALKRRVRVAVVDADDKASASLVAELTKRGFDAATFETAFPMTAWPQGIEAYKPEFVVVDHVSMSPTEQTSLIERARAFGAQVAFCGQNDNAVARRNAMSAGAIEWFAKPCDCEKLVELLTAHAIAVSDSKSATTRAILFEKKAQPFKVARNSITLRKDHLGMGGVFIPNEELLSAIGTGVQAGDWIEFKLNVDNRPSPVSSRGQVVWRAAEGEAPGAGVRFSFLDFETQSWLSSVLLEQGNRSYIPAGVRR